MGQKTHPIQLRTRKPTHTCWHTRAQYANLLHYTNRFHKELPKLLRQSGFQGPGYIAWTGKGFYVVQTCLPTQGEGSSSAFSQQDLFSKNAHRIELSNSRKLPPKQTLGGGKAPQLSDSTCEQDTLNHNVVHQLSSILQAREHHGVNSNDIQSRTHAQSSVYSQQSDFDHHTQRFQEYTQQPQWLPVLAHARSQGWWGRGMTVVTLESAYQHAQTLADLLRHKIEQNGKAHQVADEAIQYAQTTWWIQGMKVRIAGRLQGAEIASAHTKQWGLLGLNTLSQRVDYASAEAYTQVGIIGIQVWLSIRVQKAGNS